MEARKPAQTKGARRQGNPVRQTRCAKKADQNAEKQSASRKRAPERKTTPKGSEQVRRRTTYHDNDGETVGASDAPRSRFGDANELRKDRNLPGL